MEVFLECCMTLFFSAAMLLLIVRLAKGEDVCACVLPGVQRRFLDWNRPHRRAEPERISDVLLHHRRNAFLHGDGLCHAA